MVTDFARNLVEYPAALYKVCTEHEIYSGISVLTIIISVFQQHEVSDLCITKPASYRSDI